MNTFDIVVIVVVSFCLIRGLFKGLVGEVSGIIGVVAGFYGSFTYYPMVAVYFKQWIESPGLRNVLAFFLLFLAISFLVGLISLLIRKILKLVFLGWVDQTFGLVFGAAKGVLLMSVLFIMMTTFLPKNSSLLKGSILSPYLAQVSQALTVFISKNNKSDFLNNLEGLF